MLGGKTGGLRRRSGAIPESFTKRRVFVSEYALGKIMGVFCPDYSRIYSNSKQIAHFLEFSRGDYSQNFPVRTTDAFIKRRPTYVRRQIS